MVLEVGIPPGRMWCLLLLMLLIALESRGCLDVVVVAGRVGKGYGGYGR